MKRSLSLEAFETTVHLGWHEDERAQAQWVSFRVEVHFDEPPQAELSDELKDTVCYETLCKHLEAVCRARSYHLIEHLAHVALSQLQKAYPEQRFVLEVHKLRPPIAGLKGGTKYRIEGSAGH